VDRGCAESQRRERVTWVDEAAEKWWFGSAEVRTAFQANLDDMYPTPYYVAGLLERGVDVLVYVGTYDHGCNWLGSSRWVESMEWGGQAEYGSENFAEWTVSGNRAGITKRARGLTFATLEAAGHMVPYDKTVEALAMLNRWLGNRSITETA